MAEVNERSVAIRACGEEIVALRRQVQAAAAREEDLQQQLQRHKQQVDAEVEVRPALLRRVTATRAR
jgi:hypothetical protein